MSDGNSIKHSKYRPKFLQETVSSKSRLPSSKMRPTTGDTSSFSSFQNKANGILQPPAEWDEQMKKEFHYLPASEKEQLSKIPSTNRSKEEQKLYQELTKKVKLNIEIKKLKEEIGELDSNLADLSSDLDKMLKGLEANKEEENQFLIDSNEIQEINKKIEANLSNKDDNPNENSSLDQLREIQEKKYNLLSAGGWLLQEALNRQKFAKAHEDFVKQIENSVIQPLANRKKELEAEFESIKSTVSEKSPTIKILKGKTEEVEKTIDATRKILTDLKNTQNPTKTEDIQKLFTNAKNKIQNTIQTNMLAPTSYTVKNRDSTGIKLAKNLINIVGCLTVVPALAATVYSLARYQNTKHVLFFSPTRTQSTAQDVLKQANNLQVLSYGK